MLTTEEIRNRVSLRQLAEEAGARFSNPNRLRCTYPLPRHAGDRSGESLSIYENGRKWKCHSSCPPEFSGGDVIAFYMAWKNVDFKTAAAELSERICAAPVSHATSNPVPMEVTVPAAAPVPNDRWRARAAQFVAYAQNQLQSDAGSRARAYLQHARGLYPETWHTFGVGYNPQTRYDLPEKWGLPANSKKIWLPRGIVLPGIWQGEVWYVKVRRIRTKDDELAQYLGAWQPADGLPDVKFGGPRGGQSILFGADYAARLPVLVLTEGEWDALLAFQYCGDFCDVATLGGAGAHVHSRDLSVLLQYPRLLAVYDDDAAGADGRTYLNGLSERVQTIAPPAHDLTDFWKTGGNLRAWLGSIVTRTYANLFEQFGSTLPETTFQRWLRLAERACNAENSR